MASLVLDEQPVYADPAALDSVHDMRVRAMIDRLRNRGLQPQPPTEAQTLRGFGTLAALMNPHQVQAGPQLTEAGNAAETRPLELQAREQQIAAGQRAAEAETSPATTKSYRSALEAFGLTGLPEEAPTPTLKALLPVAEKGYAATQANKAREAAAAAGLAGKKIPHVKINPMTGQPYLDMPGAGGLPQAPAGPPIEDPNDKRMGQMTQEVRKVFEPDQRSSPAARAQQDKINAANHLEQLLIDPLTGGPADLSPALMSEAASTAAALIGGQGGDAQTRRELTPYTKGRKWAEVWQWVADEPHGAGQQAFVKQMLQTSARQKAVAEQAIRAEQARGFTSLHTRWSKLFPQAFAQSLSGYGVTPEEAASGKLMQSGGAAKADPMAAAKAQLQPGERLAIDPQGKAHGLSAGEAVPTGWTVVP